MTPNDLLAEGVLACKALTARYLAGFDDANHTCQAPGLPNHAAWSLGHCALTMHRIADHLEGAAAGGLPAPDFFDPGEKNPALAGQRHPEDRGPAPTRFNTESVCFGSAPAAEPSLYPAMARCAEIYDAACDRLAAVARAASPESLQRMIAWGPIQLPLWAAVQRMVFHNGMHTGQIADLRRNLGLKSIFA